MFPVYRAVQPDDSLPPLASFVIQTLAYAAVVAWAMFVRGRRQSRRERVRHFAAEQELTGLPVFHPDPEPVDGLALATKGIEAVGLLMATSLLRRPLLTLTPSHLKGT